MTRAEQEVTITVTPDPLWTAADEAAAQFWLDLMRVMTAAMAETPLS